MTDYVFGYGSLLERASRTRTNPDAVGAWPARVTGYSRGWYHQFADYVGSTFTQEFISSTTSWNANWVNDRIYPRRSLFTLPKASEIDQALKEGNVLHYVQLHDLR